MAQMEVRHQVFVSSTYEDLREERQEVMHALLELGCIPSGMELFPAANEDQWSTIQSVIDECDYYILILGGRYGSIGPDGVGYTEKEYRYALEQGKPVLSFLHGKPGALSADKTEGTDEGKKKLQAFRKLAQKKLCKTWTTPEGLGAVVSRGLTNLQRRHPAVGWVRGDLVPSKGASEEILSLRKKIDQLQEQLQATRVSPPPGTDILAQGQDVIRIRFSYSTRPKSEARPESEAVDYLAEISSALSLRSSEKNLNATVDLVWDDICYHVLPGMINETTDTDFFHSLGKLVREKAWESLTARHDSKNLSLFAFFVRGEDFQTIKVQLRALGLIQQSTKPRAVKDTATYWTLTPYGDNVMTQLRAIRRAK